MRSPENDAPDPGVPTGPRSRTRGFTLIEVLIATAIMSIGMVTTLQLFSGSLGLAGSSARQTKALVLARAVLDENLWRAEIQEDILSGTEGDYTWQVEIFPIERSLVSYGQGPGLGSGDEEEEDADYELFALRATVVWEASGIERSVVLSTARLVEAEL